MLLNKSKNNRLPLLFIEQASNQVIDLPNLLTSREERRVRQQSWLAKHQNTLISLTVISPGAIKDSPLTRSIFLLAWQAINQLCIKQRWSILASEVVVLPTGIEGYIALPQPPNQVKKATINLEQQWAIGRLWDIDVINPKGVVLSRDDFNLPARHCLICQQDAKICGRSQTHSIAELLTMMKILLADATN